LHRLASSFVLGYHGCDRAVGERLLRGEAFRESRNAYDWLGPGVYFWEANPLRAMAFAEESRVKRRGNIREPFVVGAVLELGYCLDLTTEAGITQVRNAYASLAEVTAKAGLALPTNSDDQLRRNLDCAVIDWLHKIVGTEGRAPIDTVRGVFVEGAAAYPGSGIREKTHIQIAVRNGACVKGVFRVPERDLRG
jgi:hypothetical protein